MPGSKTVASALALVLVVTLFPWFSSSAKANESLVARIEALDAGFTVEVLGNRLLARQALSNFYAANSYERAWRSADQRHQLLEAIESASRDGLDPRDYHADVLAELSNRPMQDLPDDLQADLDLLYSDAFLMLGSHLLEGKVSPYTIHAEWTANRRQRNMGQVLAAALVNGDISAAVDALRPTHSDYHRLVQARQTMTGLLGRPWLPIPTGATIRPGDRDHRLIEIRRRLTALGDLSGSGAPDPSLYGGELETALPLFQARHGLEPDGIIGPATLAAINLLPIERVHQIDASLERWRWLPESLGERFVLVNIAGYELKMMDQGVELLRQRVIVGQPFRQTPVFSDRIRYLVLNPTWTVPRRLMIEDQLPRIIRDPDYLQRLNMKVYRGWGADRQQVDPAAINWGSLSPNNFPYQLVQDPGPNNALGQIKFMFPNRYDVYLHDTPSRDLFGRVDRSFSSGCIRVEQPFALAEQLLLGDPNWNRERIHDTVGSNQPKTILLPEPVPVYIQYWTAWVDNRGQLQFRNDIYNRDSRLLARLREDASGGSHGLTPAAVSYQESQANDNKEQP
ncbi:L,D-transpeptidase family protein [Marinobacter apostichopi]|uniref:L,D-transpeptidase family protein n=1 Tax=Marinobacter apostichopi TaxID=3035454 RepID=UPI00257385A6|nr:L,D-transpeptidase family protein [Marinobacter sp. LA51]